MIKSEHTYIKKLSIFFIVCYLTIHGASAQIKLYKKVEIGYFVNQGAGKKYDLSETDLDWKGPALKNEQNAVSVSFINGFSFFNNKLLTGAAAGYLNFQGIHGLSLLSEIEYIPFGESGSPFLNARLGYSHIWSVYTNGTGSAFMDIGGGVKFNLYKQVDMYLKSGFLYTQDHLFFPIMLGAQF